MILNTKKGNITPALLIIATTFIMVIYGLLFILTLQFGYSHRQIASDKALHIAEAGINYYQWHLMESPGDYQDGIHDYKDPQGEVVGQFSIKITPPGGGSSIVTIRSTGWINQYPKIKRTIVARYGEVSLTEFAFVVNENLWFGNDVTVNGKVFSNGGIRQDGTNTSTFQSAKETYICGLESGCTSPTEKPGIWGNGKDETLWEFPVLPIDFDGMDTNFNQIKQDAQSDGLYLPPSEDQGYHITFALDGSFSVCRVTGTSFLKAYSPQTGCENSYQIIESETAKVTHQVTDNNIIFVEDTLWVEGIVNGKTTLAAARFPLDLDGTNIWIPNNLTYIDMSGDTKLGLIAQTDIVFTRDVPETFEVNGVLLAQNGRVIRHHYKYFDCKSTGASALKNEFIFYGSMLSNKRSYWNFSSGPGSPASGFVKSTLTFDPNVGDDPPGYFPSAQYQFISWSEERN